MVCAYCYKVSSYSSFIWDQIDKQDRVDIYTHLIQIIA